jgi:hypothetical protein
LNHETQLIGGRQSSLRSNQSFPYEPQHRTGRELIGQIMSFTTKITKEF